MGMIRQDFGNISLEQRRESFYIVPSYGWKQVYPQVPLSEIKVGACFRYSLPGVQTAIAGGLDPDYPGPHGRGGWEHGSTRRTGPGKPNDEPWQVVGQLLEKTLIKPATRVQAGDGDAVDPKHMVHPLDEHYAPDSTEVEVDTPFARQWRDHPAPEFLNEDLDDLIAALEDLRQALAS